MQRRGSFAAETDATPGDVDKLDNIVIRAGYFDTGFGLTKGNASGASPLADAGNRLARNHLFERSEVGNEKRVRCKLCLVAELAFGRPVAVNARRSRRFAPESGIAGDKTDTVVANFGVSDDASEHFTIGVSNEYLLFDRQGAADHDNRAVVRDGDGAAVIDKGESAEILTGDSDGLHDLT
jgi:hypothetical protein